MKKVFYLIFWILWASPVLSQDRFGDIGTRTYETKEDLLTVPQPPVLPDLKLPVTNDPKAQFKPVRPISTKEELYAQLDQLRKEYLPFMENMAPELEATRSHIPLKEFKWRIETGEDVKNFSGTLMGDGQWEEVTIPHYGPPLGRAVTYYYKEVDLDEKSFNKGSLFLCFKGVDYKATVFFNGAYCGSHEGFFAPFEFNVFDFAHPGKNRILVKVENDYSTTGGTDDRGNEVVGDKIYAATGPGYDEPSLGWHHCPPGMGIYQDCYLEARAPLHINDLYVRPMLKDSIAEAWIEINNLNKFPEGVSLKISVYGQNFADTVLEDLDYIPSTTYIPGVGDLAKPEDWKKSRLSMGYGVNYLRVPIKMGRFRMWNTTAPWLYQLQVKLYNEDGKLTDSRVRQFGMRSFEMDTLHAPKGKMYLNGQFTRLRGANTMGHLQQCVMKKDWDQLRDDILLAKLANMNYLRLTQRPVQEEIYDYCDKLGLMNQADMPLFGSIRRNKFAEAVKQAEELERLVRKHPSTIVVSYINERFPNAEGHPQRSLNTSEEYYHLFKAMDQTILLSNPDRVIKAGDGDYDPPSPGLPDSHCYNTWYNGHGLGLGEMYKGYWQPIKAGWYYGCGEFGAEGLDPLNVMEKYYPKAWLPTNNEDEKTWTANRIAMSQTQRFHYMWYNTQHSLEDWIEASQDYQAWAVKFVAETFRRDPRMVSFAVHLFIDAWPAGWMKAIMDVDRQPKKAYFAYRNALEPVMVSIRSDRRYFYSGEETACEVWLCNDLNTVPEGYQLKYQVEKDGRVVMANQTAANLPVNSAAFQGYINYKTPEVSRRTHFVVRVGLFDQKGKSVNQNEFEFDVFPKRKPVESSVYLLTSAKGKGYALLQELGMTPVDTPESAGTILIDDYDKYQSRKEEIDRWVSDGKNVVFIELPANEYRIGGTTLTVEKTIMGDYYFVSPETGNPLVKDFGPFDFRFWYDEQQQVIAPILAYTIAAPQWSPVLSSGASNWVSDKGAVMAAAELSYGKGTFRVSEVILENKLNVNPPAWLFMKKMLEK